MREEWYSFKEGSWVNEINVRSFIKRNFTLYEGDESFLVGPTEATKKLSEKIVELNAGGLVGINTINYFESYNPLMFIIRGITTNIKSVECNGKECYLVNENLLG